MSVLSGKEVFRDLFLTNESIQEMLKSADFFIIEHQTYYQPSPLRRDERPVSCYAPSNNSHHHHHTSLGPAGRDAAGLLKDKQRTFLPSLVNNETYGTILSSGPQQPGSPAAPPLPPRNLGKQPKEGSGIKIMCPMILTCVVPQGQWILEEVFSKVSMFYRCVL